LAKTQNKNARLNGINLDANVQSAIVFTVFKILTHVIYTAIDLGKSPNW
jgi:hypothetical protein